jgi:hypothetical protein
MSNSKKENILNKLELIIRNIVIGNKPSESSDKVFENTISFVDRQYIGVSMADVENSKMPWVLINNEGETLKGRPSKNFDSQLFIQIIGFVKAENSDQNLDSLLNSLQRDIMVAILEDESLGGVCSYLIPREIYVVDELVWPFGGFVLNLEIEYSFSGTNL